MTCLDDDKVAALLDGRLSEPDREQVELHVDRCSSCRQLVGAVARTQPGRTEPDAPPMPMWSHGWELSRYVVLDVIGSGGMGVVYSAYDPVLDRKVAVKVLRPGPDTDSDVMRTRIVAEAQAMAKLSHPNVVTVFDVSTVGDRIFIVMALVDGLTLRRWLRTQARTPAEIVDVFRRAGQGMAAAHAAGLVHRDFKPDNVLIGADGRVLVTDFGLARSTDRPESPPESGAVLAPLAGSGVVRGTPVYMAPEQLRGEPATARSDLFSFCVALHEALHGERPFPGDTPAALLRSIEQQELRVQPKAKAVPARLRRVVSRGLSPRPGERYATMNELLAALGHDAIWRRRVAVAALALVAVLSTVAVAVRETAQGPCDGAERHLVGAWDAPRKRAVAQSLASTGKPWAAEVNRSVERSLDAYAHDWVQMWTQACKATQVKGTQTEEQLAKTMSCLDRRLEEMRTLSSVLAGPNPPLDSAAQAAAALTPLRRCSDGDRHPVVPSSDAAGRRLGHWGQTYGPPIDQGSYHSQTCFLLSIAGALTGDERQDGERAQVGLGYDLSNPGHYTQWGRSGRREDGSIVETRVKGGSACLLTVAGRIFGTWESTPPGQPTSTTTLGPVTATRRCFLEKISAGTGNFHSSDDGVRITNDGRSWYLTGTVRSAPNGTRVTASAVCVDLPGEAVSLGPLSAGEGPVTHELMRDTGSVVCGLTGFSGAFEVNDFENGIVFQWPAPPPGWWRATVSPGKTAWVACAGMSR